MYLYLVEIATIVPNISVKHRLVKTASLNDETKHSTNEERSKEQTNKIILDTTYFSRDSYFTNFAILGFQTNLFSIHSLVVQFSHASDHQVLTFLFRELQPQPLN